MSDSKYKEYLVSVIILSHNGEKFIDNCIKSVIATKYKPMEIIVVDNFSNDQTPQIARGFENQIKIIRTDKNLSFAKANNIGIENSKGDVVVLLNDDTHVQSGWIKSMVDLFRKETTVGIIGCKILYPDSNVIQHFGGYVKPNGITMHYGYGCEDGDDYSMIKDVEYVTGAAFAIRRELIETIGYLPEVYKPIYFEEVEYCFSARKKGWRVVVDPNSIIYHHESQKTIAKSFGFFYKYHKNRIRFITRNFEFHEKMSALPDEFRWIMKNFSPKQLTSLFLAYVYNFFLFVNRSNKVNKPRG
jgi:O-antigen biosynthesis protein